MFHLEENKAVKVNLEKTERFVLELTYNDENCDIDTILERIINTVSVGKGIREIVNEARVYNYLNGRKIIGRSN